MAERLVEMDIETTEATVLLELYHPRLINQPSRPAWSNSQPKPTASITPHTGRSRWSSRRQHCKTADSAGDDSEWATADEEEESLPRGRITRRNSENVPAP
eukprot:jgi/Tetstr1/442209/TSEL_030356.t1